MNKKNIKRILFLLVIVLIGSYLFYFNDYFAYRKVINEPTTYNCEEYIKRFPNGYFIEDVKVIEIKLTNDIQKVRSFLQTYPNSTQYSIVNTIKNDLWQEEISKYEALTIGKNSNPDAISFFRKLLWYMRDENLSTICVTLNNYTRLKDWNEYEPDIRQFIDEWYEEDGDLPVSNNILPLKSNFTQGDIKILENIVIQGIKESFENVFSDNFLFIESTNLNKIEDHSLIINIDYSIVTQLVEEFDYEVPNIWIYTIDEVFNSYLLAIEIEFDFRFSIPNSNDTYNFNMKTDPGDEINDVADIRDGYRKMAQITFANYANNISNRFGIDSPYFNNL